MHPLLQTFVRKYQACIALGCIAFVIGLSAYVYQGSFIRLSGDDYCYGAVLTKYGFWGAQAYSYNNPMPFHGNRFSLTFFSSVVGLSNPATNGLLPGLIIILWIVGLFLLIKAICIKVNCHLHDLEKLLISEFIVFITLYIAPDLPESLYWRSGMFPYLVPIIFIIYLLVLILSYKPNVRSSAIVLGLILITSFVSGGFSETTTAFQAGILFVCFVVILLRHKGSGEFSAFYKAPVIFALAGTGIASILLISSPAIEIELSTTAFSQGLVDSTALTLQYAWDFVVDSLKSVPLPFLLILSFFAVLSILVARRLDQQRIQNRSRLVLHVVLLIILGYLLIAFSIAPAAFVRSVKPNPRGLIATRFVMVVVFASLGWLVGSRISQFLAEKCKIRALIYFGSILVFTLISLYPVRSAIRTLSGISHYQKWATLWDIRDSNIREAKARGEQDVEVMHLDKTIKWVGELSSDPNSWYNICAAEYYGVNSIRATIQVWDE